MSKHIPWTASWACLTCIFLKDAEQTEMTLEGECALDSRFKIQEEQAKNMLKQTCLWTSWKCKLKRCLRDCIWNPAHVAYLRISIDDG